MKSAEKNLAEKQKIIAVIDKSNSLIAAQAERVENQQVQAVSRAAVWHEAVVRECRGGIKEPADLVVRVDVRRE